ncbi:MAG: gamma-glutamyltransferase [Azospirillaceae bacterium]
MASRSEWVISKTQAESDDGLVATMYPQASEAGAEMLRRGGNAIDAAVAAGFAVGVCEPFNSGLGGIAVLVYYDNASGKTHVFDGTGVLPRAIRPDQFPVADKETRTGIYGWPMVEGDINNTGYLTPAVPGMPGCLLDAHAAFGRLGRGDVMAPAIHHAEQGFKIDWYVALGMAVNQTRLQQFPESRRTYFRADGSCYRCAMLGVEGDIFAQPDLARTLRLLAAEGADAFYKGEIARKIDADMRANGGLLRYEDLAGYRVRHSEGGIAGEYRGCQIIGGLDNTGFPTVMQALNLLEAYDLRAMGQGSVEECHIMAEAQRAAFTDRLAYLGDADSVPVPLQGLLSKDYAARRGRDLAMDRANLDRTPGDPWAFDPGRPGGLAPGHGGDSQTTHLTVIDRDRNMVSLLSTLGLHFGSAVVAKDTGVVLNNGTMWFDPVPGTVNSLAPGRRGLTAGAPIVVLKDGRPLMTVGSPGGRRVVTSIIHALVNVIDHGMGPQEAVSTLRVHSENETTVVDARMAPGTMAALEKLGHRLDIREETFSTTYFGRPNAVVVDPASGRLQGGVNPFKPTLAIGV